MRITMIYLGGIHGYKTHESTKDYVASNHGMHALVLEEG